MAFEDKYFDPNGKEMKIGTRVFVPDYDDPEKKCYGTVTALDPQEGDVDDEGRPTAYGPYVTVDWDDVGEERFSGYVSDVIYEPDSKTGYPFAVGAHWSFDDVEVA